MMHVTSDCDRSDERTTAAERTVLLRELAEAGWIDDGERSATAGNQVIVLKLVQQTGHSLARGNSHAGKLLVGERHGKAEFRFAARSGVGPLDQQLGQPARGGTGERQATGIKSRRTRDKRISLAKKLNQFLSRREGNFIQNTPRRRS